MRRSLIRRALMLAGALACGTLALLSLAASGEARNGLPPAAPATEAPHSKPTASVLARGRHLFLSSCAVCHGMHGEGRHAVAPSLHGAGELAADFYLQTGRMPLPYPKAEPTRDKPAFDQSDIHALIRYIGTEFGGPGIPVVQPRKGSLVHGQEVFAMNCAGCHTIQAQGGVVTGAAVPSLNVSTPTQVGEAVRIGPYLMPRFSKQELTRYDVNSLARYVQSIQSPEDRGGWGIGRLGPIPEGMVTWLLALVAILLVARLLGERSAPRRRSP